MKRIFIIALAVSMALSFSFLFLLEDNNKEIVNQKKEITQIVEKNKELEEKLQNVSPFLGGSPIINGIAYYDVITTTTDLLATSGGTQDMNIAIPGGYSTGTIDFVIIERIDGNGTSLQVKLMTSDAFTTDFSYLFGGGFGSGTNTASTTYGPQPTIGGGSAILAQPFIDSDGTNELHMRVINNDFTSSQQLRFTLYVREIY